MEKYREKLKIQIGLFLMGALVLIAVQILGFNEVITPVTGDDHWHGFWNGMMAGAAFGVSAVFLAGIVLNVLALKNEKRLKKQYAKDHDERTAKIVSQAQAAGMQAFLVVGIVAMIVAGYFSTLVSVTILGCIFTAAMITAGFKLYYHFKF